MIAPAVWNPALAAARAQTAQHRHDAAMAGMAGVIADFFTDSYTCWASRSADGLGPIDNAANALSAGWVGWGGAGIGSDAAVTALLNACESWLTNRRLFGYRITGWREEPIAKLYWQTAWCYATDWYRQQAVLTIGVNNLAGNPTLMTDPVVVAAPVGNPYDFPGGLSGYTHQGLPVGGRALRGDSRGPESFDPAQPAGVNGFQGNNVGGANYRPFFYGNAAGDTTSVTDDPALAINAASAALALGYQLGAGPVWLADEMQRLGVQGRLRGYVYEMNVANAASTRVTGSPHGREHIFLALPAATIINWWAIAPNRHTFGPYPFPAPVQAPGVPPGPALPAAPGVAANLSGAPNQLA